MQDLDQSAVYVSSRRGPMLVDSLAIPHAERALNALRREHGSQVDETPLGRALLRRTALTAAEASHEDEAGRLVLRDKDSGRFAGVARPAAYRKGDD